MWGDQDLPTLIYWLFPFSDVAKILSEIYYTKLNTAACRSELLLSVFPAPHSRTLYSVNLADFVCHVPLSLKHGDRSTFCQVVSGQGWDEAACLPGLRVSDGGHSFCSSSKCESWTLPKCVPCRGAPFRLLSDSVWLDENFPSEFIGTS